MCSVQYCIYIHDINTVPIEPWLSLYNIRIA